MSAVLDSQGHPVCGAAQIPALVEGLGRAVCPLLDAALQQHDWQQPSHLQDIDACSILLKCLSQHLLQFEPLRKLAEMLPILGEPMRSRLRGSGEWARKAGKWKGSAGQSERAQLEGIQQLKMRKQHAWCMRPHLRQPCLLLARLRHAKK